MRLHWRGKVMVARGYAACERSGADRLQNSVQQLESQCHDYQARVDDLSTKERELNDKSRDQVCFFI